jgi:hypothetical protein
MPCGQFPVAGLDSPLGAEDQPGPQAEALRQVIRDSPDIDEATTWRLVDENDNRVMYVAQLETEWLCVVLELRDDDWVQTEEAGSTELYLTLANGLGPARWTATSLDPSDEGGVALSIMVQEQDCASGSNASGRIAPPLVEYDVDSLTITIGVRPVSGGATCPSNPWTPAVLLIPTGIDGLVLLDGSVFPPREVATTPR